MNKSQVDYAMSPAYDMNMKTQSRTASYFAVYEPATEGGYNVSFPDFPGCVTFGRTFEEAQAMAQEVLALWIEELRARKSVIPRAYRRPILDEVAVQMSL